VIAPARVAQAQATQSYHSSIVPTVPTVPIVPTVLTVRIYRLIRPAWTTAVAEIVVWSLMGACMRCHAPESCAQSLTSRLSIPIERSRQIIVEVDFRSCRTRPASVRRDVRNEVLDQSFGPLATGRRRSETSSWPTPFPIPTSR